MRRTSTVPTVRLREYLTGVSETPYRDARRREDLGRRRACDSQWSEQLPSRLDVPALMLVAVLEPLVLVGLVGVVVPVLATLLRDDA